MASSRPATAGTGQASRVAVSCGRRIPPWDLIPRGGSGGRALLPPAIPSRGTLSLVWSQRSGGSGWILWTPQRGRGSGKWRSPWAGSISWVAQRRVWGEQVWGDPGVQGRGWGGDAYGVPLGFPGSAPRGGSWGRGAEVTTVGGAGGHSITPRAWSRAVLYPVPTSSAKGTLWPQGHGWKGPWGAPWGGGTHPKAAGRGGLSSPGVGTDPFVADVPVASRSTADPQGAAGHRSGA